MNIDSPFHNGHKYEPLSIMHYEFDFNTKVGEFGCKAHTKFPFLRASPDHGPAFDIAKKKIARIDSLVASFNFLKKFT